MPENTSNPLKDGIERRKQQSQIEIAESLLSLSKGVTSAIEYLEQVVRDEDMSSDERYQAAMALLNKVIPDRTEMQGSGIDAPDIAATFEGISKEVEENI